MKEIFSNVGSMLEDIFEFIFDDPFLSSVLLAPLLIAPFFMIVKMLGILMGDVHFSFGSVVVEFFCLVGRKIVDLLCRSERGFHLAYKMGWAKSGVHFFDCGVDCDKCPKYVECTDGQRIAFDSNGGVQNAE